MQTARAITALGFFRPRRMCFFLTPFNRHAMCILIFLFDKYPCLYSMASFPARSECMPCESMANDGIDSLNRASIPLLAPPANRWCLRRSTGAGRIKREREHRQTLPVQREPGITLKIIEGREIANLYSLEFAVQQAAIRPA